MALNTNIRHLENVYVFKMANICTLVDSAQLNGNSEVGCISKVQRSKKGPSSCPRQPKFVADNQ